MAVKTEVLHDLKRIARAMRILSKECDKLYKDLLREDGAEGKPSGTTPGKG